MLRSRLAESMLRSWSANLHRPGSVGGITAERVARATLHGHFSLLLQMIVPWTMHVPVKLYQPRVRSYRRQAADPH
jgi:predicted Abi (CAAX) family protease